MTTPFSPLRACWPSATAASYSPTWRDEGYKLIAKLFKFIGGVKLYTSDSFHTSRGAPYVRCVHKSEGGLLYFMERTLFFIHKPTLQIAYDVGEKGGSHA